MDEAEGVNDGEELKLQEANLKERKTSKTLVGHLVELKNVKKK